VDKLIGTVIIVAILALVFTGMALAWRARRRRQGGLGDLATTEVSGGVEVLYLATTVAGSPLDRVTTNGLGFRARARVEPREDGLVLALAGEPARLIPRVALRGAGHANWTIDRATGGDRLVAVRWLLGDAEVESYLRADDPDALLAALGPLLPVPTESDAA